MIQKPTETRRTTAINRLSERVYVVREYTIPAVGEGHADNIVNIGMREHDVLGTIKNSELNIYLMSFSEQQ